MSITIQPLFEPTPLAAAATQYFTASSAVRLDKVTVSNPGGSTASVNVYLVPSGSRPNAYNEILPPLAVAAGASTDLDTIIGHAMAAGDSLWAQASIANQLVLFCTGLVIST